MAEKLNENFSSVFSSDDIGSLSSKSDYLRQLIINPRK